MGGVFDTSTMDSGIFTLEPDPEAVAVRARSKTEARAIRQSQRTQLARANSEAELATLLPARIARGDSWHVISGGKIDGLSYLQHLIEAGSFEHVILSTWCMALEDVKQLATWMQAGRIDRLDVYVGEIFPSQYAPAFETLCSTVRENKHGGRVAVFRNHSKVTVAASHDRDEYVVIESSANLNTNPRTEQTCLTHSRDLAEFYADFFGSIKSFQRNFDDWTPHAWPIPKTDRPKGNRRKSRETCAPAA